MEFVRVQEKKIFKKLIENADLSFSDFVERDDNLQYRLTLRNTPFYIVFLRDPKHFTYFNLYIIRYVPKFPMQILAASSPFLGIGKGFAPMEKVMEWMNSWLTNDVKPYIKHQIEAKEWYDSKTVNQEYSSLNISADASEMFNAQDHPKIIERLELCETALNKLIISNESLPEQIKIAHSRQLNQLFDYLKKESKTQTIFSWVSLALGAFQIFQPLIGIDPTTVAQYFLNMVVKSLPTLRSISPINLIGK
jgi:hypothetical protein